jgi:hypothetical protein
MGIMKKLIPRLRLFCKSGRSIGHSGTKNGTHPLLMAGWGLLVQVRRVILHHVHLAAEIWRPSVWDGQYPIRFINTLGKFPSGEDPHQSAR